MIFSFSFSIFLILTPIQKYFRIIKGRLIFFQVEIRSVISVLGTCRIIRCSRAVIIIIWGYRTIDITWRTIGNWRRWRSILKLVFVFTEIWRRTLSVWRSRFILTKIVSFLELWSWVSIWHISVGRLRITLSWLIIILIVIRLRTRLSCRSIRWWSICRNRCWKRKPIGRTSTAMKLGATSLIVKWRRRRLIVIAKCLKRT